MLSQLVYVSNRKPICAQEEIDKILASCKKNNPGLDITGILLYNDIKFIQLVEGEAKVIMDLYDKIKKDSRHSNCMMISMVRLRKNHSQAGIWALKRLPIMTWSSKRIFQMMTSSPSIASWVEKKRMDKEY